MKLRFSLSNKTNFTFPFSSFSLSFSPSSSKHLPSLRSLPSTRLQLNQTRAFSSTRSFSMPPKGSKRKSVDSLLETKDDPKTKTSTKKSKKEVSNSLSAPDANVTEQPSPSEIPRNDQIPEQLEFQSRPDGQIRISSWNIVSFKSSKEKGLFRYIEAEDPDVLVLSETKVNDLSSVEISSDTKPLRDRYPYRYWGIGEKKGYAGIAILSKIKPVSKEIGLPGFTSDSNKGRLITIEFENTYVIGTYAVNAGEGLKSMEEKKKWNAAFAKHLSNCDSKKSTIWCGDLNVVLDQRDLSGAQSKWNKRPGYTEIECEAHRQILDGTHRFAEEGVEVGKFKDIWRELHPEAVGHYTYYGFRGFCRSKGLGWRLDSYIVSERIASKVKSCEIRHEVYGASDHVPIICDIEGPL